MFIYVIRAHDTRHKVGIAVAPERRLKELQTGSGDVLSIVVKRDVGKYLAARVERAAHLALAKFRLAGEWFSVSAEEASDAVEAAIRQYMTTPDLPMAQPKKSPTCLRIPPDVIEGVTEWASAKGVARNAAYVHLLRLGLQAVSAGSPPPRTEPAAKIPPKPKAATAEPKPRAFVSRLKGEWKAP
jgi:hypothetical protein